MARAAGMFFHTDVEDFGAVMREVARCLCSGGRLVYLGVHPWDIAVAAEKDRQPR